MYLDDAPLAQVDAGTPEVLTYLHTDHLGTPRFGTNTGGTQVWAWASDAFGNGTPSGSRIVNLRMPGQYYDAESSLFYNWNRYYNPAIGRYVSSDPIGIDGGLNTFLYAEASPVMYGDPEGLIVDRCTFSPPGATGCVFPEVGGGRSGGTGTIDPVKVIKGAIKGLLNENPDNPSKTQEEILATNSAVCTGGGPGDPDDDENSEHAKERMQERGISQERIDEAKRIGRIKAGNTPKEKVYEVPSRESASGRGIKVVIDAQTGK